jgi:hypothetical protein
MSKFPGQRTQEDYERRMQKSKTELAPLSKDYTFKPNIPKRLTNEEMAAL